MDSKLWPTVKLFVTLDRLLVSQFVFVGSAFLTAASTTTDILSFCVQLFLKVSDDYHKRETDQRHERK